MKPLPFREVQRRLEAAGFIEVGQTGSHVKFAKSFARELELRLSRSTVKLLRAHFEAYFAKLE